MKIPAYLGREIIGTKGVKNTWKYSMTEEIRMDLFLPQINPDT